MKKCLLCILIGLFGFNLPAQTADQAVASGLTFLAQQNLVSANQQFINALALSPTNGAANALAAVTRLLLLPNTRAGSNFLNTLKYPAAGRNIYNWTSSLPVDANGKQLLPSVNTAAMIAFYRTNVMAALAASRTNLARITDTNFTLSLTAAETSMQAVTLDYGDILLLQALERVAEFAGYTANGQNGDVVLSQLQALDKTNGLTIQRVLTLYPSLLLQVSPTDLAASEGAFSNAAALYFAASDFIRHVRSPGAPALFVLSGDDTNDEASFRTQLTNALASLNGPAVFRAANSNSITLNASNYFAGSKTLRSLLPQFNGNDYLPDTLPDYTFGGILVNEPAYLIEKQLRHSSYPYAGIYNGAGEFGDSNGNINRGNGGVGDYAVFVGTNQQATLVGTDYGAGTADPDNVVNVSSLILQFSVDNNGNWQVNSNDFSAFGQIGQDGSFSGEVDYFTVGDFLYFHDAHRQSPLGPFQNAAGYYGGPIKGGTNTALSAILAADGEMNFLPAVADGTTGIGGLARLDANNYFMMTNLIDGTIYAGTLNPATQVINGTWTNGGHGTWTLTRAAKVPFDVPPAITRDLPTAVTAPVGTNLTVSLTATGSPPLGYQWYANGIAIPSAITNTLVFSNLQFSSAGAYSVSINNVAGKTNAAFTLYVVCNTTPPTNQIIAPTAGQHWSNALFTVTGKAAGSTAVSNVFYSLNQGGWSNATLAANASNWSAPVALAPGPNTVAAYAVDLCGNVSATNTVAFTYVVSAPLTVQLAGLGKISPNDSNALLQVGAPYTLTASAVAGTGFVFTNWTGGTSQPLTWLTNGATVKFTMLSNLVLQANFIDTNRPVLGFTGAMNSNGSLVISGTNNETVAQVYGQLNGGTWIAGAVNTNRTTWTWLTSMTNVVPGPNQFYFYALAATGSHSLTNFLTLTYPVYALLTVQTNGLGALSTNYNGSKLLLGENYAITATPAIGFRFTNWTGGANYPLGVITNSPTLHFTMATNLILEANFVETNRPKLTITAPTNSQRLSSALAYVTGTASDDWKITGVWCQLNSNSWSLATSTNGWTNWTTLLRLIAGTNTLRAFAADLGGNFSATNSLSVLSSNTFKLWFSLTNNAMPISPNGYVLNLQLSAGLDGHIQVSTNLADWTVLTNFVGTNPAVNFSDPAATNGQRFYRAVIP
jgi:hypothetical protein